MKGDNSKSIYKSHAIDNNPDKAIAANDNNSEKQQPRLISKKQAAAYCGVSVQGFDDYRRRGIVPGPIEGTRKWDKMKIDIWLDSASKIISADANPLDEWRARKVG